MIAKIPLILEPQPEGGYTVTCPLLPELITEGNTISECLANAEGAFAVVLEIYEDEGRPLPPGVHVGDTDDPPPVEVVVPVHVPVRYSEAGHKLSRLGCYEFPRRSGGSHRRWFSPEREGALPCRTGAAGTLNSEPCAP